MCLAADFFSFALSSRLDFLLASCLGGAQPISKGISLWKHVFFLRSFLLLLFLICFCMCLACVLLCAWLRRFNENMLSAWYLSFCFFILRFACGSCVFFFDHIAHAQLHAPGLEDAVPSGNAALPLAHPRLAPSALLLCRDMCITETRS